MSNVYLTIPIHFSGVIVRQGQGGWRDSDVDKCQTQKQTSQTFKMSHEMKFISQSNR